MGAPTGTRAAHCVAAGRQLWPTQRDGAIESDPKADEDVDGAFPTISFESRRHVASSATLICTHSSGNSRNDHGYSLVWPDSCDPPTWTAGRISVDGTAPIGATMFKMERLNHSRTQVYEDPCALFSVDTSKSADKLKKTENGLKFERFDVFFDFRGMPPVKPAKDEERYRSSAGLVRSCRVGRRVRPSASKYRKSAELSLYPRDRSNDFLPPAALPTESARSFSTQMHSRLVGDSGDRSVRDPFPADHIEALVMETDLARFRGESSDAAQALHFDSSACRGVQGGSITGREDCSTSQEFAERQSHEEMAQ
jgi:hypothetical protein